MSKIQAEKKPPVTKKPASIPTSMNEDEALKYAEEQCQMVFKNSTYDSDSVQQSLKNLGQMYFNYKQFRQQVAKLLITLKLPG